MAGHETQTNKEKVTLNKWKLIHVDQLLNRIITVELVLDKGYTVKIKNVCTWLNSVKILHFSNRKDILFFKV